MERLVMRAGVAGGQCPPVGRSCMFWRGPWQLLVPICYACHAVLCRAIPGWAAMGTKPPSYKINSWAFWPGFCRTNLAGTRGSKLNLRFSDSQGSIWQCCCEWRRGPVPRKLLG